MPRVCNVQDLDKVFFHCVNIETQLQHINNLKRVNLISIDKSFGLL